MFGYLLALWFAALIGTAAGAARSERRYAPAIDQLRAESRQLVAALALALHDVPGTLRAVLLPVPLPDPIGSASARLLRVLSIYGREPDPRARDLTVSLTVAANAPGAAA